MVTQKDRRHSGRVTYGPRHPELFPYESTLWDDWRDYRDGSRTRCLDKSKLTRVEDAKRRKTPYRYTIHRNRYSSTYQFIDNELVKVGTTENKNYGFIEDVDDELYKINKNNSKLKKQIKIRNARKIMKYLTGK
jgi:hypothetical protein